MRVPPHRQAQAVDRARVLRRTATPAEVKLWRALRNRGLDALRAKRQVPCGPYILDFAIPSAALAIEVDGHTHGTDVALARDERRDRFLEARDIRVLRFTNGDVMRNLGGVLEAIRIAAKARLHPRSDTGGDPLPDPRTLTPALSRTRERERSA